MSKRKSARPAPRKTEPVAISRLRSSVVPPRASRVLVVEDDPDVARSIARLLGVAGHDVRVAQDGPSGMSVAREFAPDVMLLDESMPALDAKPHKAVPAELNRIQSRYQVTFILVTHDQDEAIVVSDRIPVMHDGSPARGPHLKHVVP